MRSRLPQESPRGAGCHRDGARRGGAQGSGILFNFFFVFLLRYDYEWTGALSRNFYFANAYKGIFVYLFIGKERDHIWTRNGSLKSGVNTEKMKRI